MIGRREFLASLLSAVLLAAQKPLALFGRSYALVRQ